MCRRFCGSGTWRRRAAQTKRLEYLFHYYLYLQRGVSRVFKASTPISHFSKVWSSTPVSSDLQLAPSRSKLISFTEYFLNKRKRKPVRTLCHLHSRYTYYYTFTIPAVPTSLLLFSDHLDAHKRFYRYNTKYIFDKNVPHLCVLDVLNQRKKMVVITLFKMSIGQKLMSYIQIISNE